MRGFVTFLRQYGVLALALAVIIGGKANALITAVVDGALMPIVTVFLPRGNWREWQVGAGPFTFAPGIIIAATIEFLIVAWVVYLIARKVMKEDTVTKK